MHRLHTQTHSSRPIGYHLGPYPATLRRAHAPLHGVRFLAHLNHRHTQTNTDTDTDTGTDTGKDTDTGTGTDTDTDDLWFPFQSGACQFVIVFTK
jgi:hypothetical protein